MLPVDNPSSRTLLVRECRYQGATPIAWNADLLPANSSLGDDLKRDILGGRRKMLFIEGTTQSLDLPIYSLLFPQVSVVPKASCREVEHSVRGLRESEDAHWVRAWGIVDRDRRSLEDVARLAEQGIHALSHFSVESLYYHPEMIRRLSKRSAQLIGADGDQIASLAIAQAISEAGRSKAHLVRDAVARLVHQAVMSQLPSKADIEGLEPVRIAVDTAAIAAQETAAFDQYVAGADLDALLSHYPLRESGALGRIATALGFLSRSKYEMAVRAMLQADQGDGLKFLADLFGGLVAEVAE